MINLSENRRDFLFHQHSTQFINFAAFKDANKTNIIYQSFACSFAFI